MMGLGLISDDVFFIAMATLGGCGLLALIVLGLSAWHNKSVSDEL